MSITPHKQREIIFQLLYSFDFGSGIEVLEVLMAQLEVTRKVMREAHGCSEKIRMQQALLDQHIQAHAYDYEFDRIPRVERNILRLGIYELLFATHVPPKVAIAEAMRLTRKFATKEAATFVNAVMDAVYTKHVSNGSN